MSSSSIPKADLESFSNHLKKSRRILALLGAGLSASSGLPTFRGTGGLWRSHEATSLATPEAFAQDAALVWQFYSYRRHMALQAQPNLAHHALAALARRNPEFITLSQNVDGISNPLAVAAAPTDVIFRAQSTCRPPCLPTTSSTWVPFRCSLYGI